MAERQLAKAAEPKLGLERLTLTAKQGRSEAHARIALIAQSEAAALGVQYSRITLRDQRSRWGSCSNKGTLSFNWRLVLAPHDVLDYVVVHEICHLVELNHGPDFWELVERRRPHYRDSKTGSTSTAGRSSPTARPPKPRRIASKLTPWSAGRHSTATGR